ncbi:MAG: hypothetical protein JWN27_3013 [Candidatus Eremiobacteraeota bacterium]|nr:hypothetical protein [Candidatus Eremiobacteraeota bacterium]
MDGFGEFFGGFLELFGERATEATVESAADSREGGEAYVRVLVGAPRPLNVNDQ